MAMYDFAVKFVQLGLNDTEIGLFAAVILTVPGEKLLNYLI